MQNVYKISSCGHCSKDTGCYCFLITICVLYFYHKGINVQCLLELFLLYGIFSLSFCASLPYHVQKSVLNCTNSAEKACFVSKLQLLSVLPRHLGILFYIFVYISYLWKLLNIFYHFNLILP